MPRDTVTASTQTMGHMKVLARPTECLAPRTHAPPKAFRHAERPVEQRGWTPPLIGPRSIRLVSHMRRCRASSSLFVLKPPQITDELIRMRWQPAAPIE